MNWFPLTVCMVVAVGWFVLAMTSTGPTREANLTRSAIFTAAVLVISAVSS